MTFTDLLAETIQHSARAVASVESRCTGPRLYARAGRAACTAASAGLSAASVVMVTAVEARLNTVANPARPRTSVLRVSARRLALAGMATVTAAVMRRARSAS